MYYNTNDCMPKCLAPFEVLVQCCHISNTPRVFSTRQLTGRNSHVRSMSSVKSRIIINVEPSIEEMIVLWLMKYNGKHDCVLFVRFKHKRSYLLSSFCSPTVATLNFLKVMITRLRVIRGIFLN